MKKAAAFCKARLFLSRPGCGAYLALSFIWAGEAVM